MADLHLDFIDYKKLFGDREKRLQLIDKLSFIPTVPYLKLVYWIKTGRRLNLKKPRTFSEKLNWLKIHDIHEEYTKYVDKYAMKVHVSENYGPEYVIPMLGVWDSFDDINFESLPESFVLKCTHDSGSIKIIKEKATMDKAALKRFFDGRMRINPYNMGREYPYRNVKPRIIAEEFYTSEAGQLISDCKFYCFNGSARLMYTVSGRGESEKENWFDMELNPVDIIDPTSPVTSDSYDIPMRFEEMKQFAESLSKNTKFVRVDLYYNNERFYFGELTFFPFGGFLLLKPEKWESKLGTWITL